MVDVTDPIQVRGAVIPADELSWRFSRSSGPGGQSVNTSDSRVELSYDLASSTALGPVLKQRALRALHGRLVNGVLTVSASEFRSQLRNREAAARPDGGGADRGHRPAAQAPAADQAHPRLPASGGWRPSSAAPRSSACAAPPTSSPAAHSSPEKRSQADCRVMSSAAPIRAQVAPSDRALRTQCVRYSWAWLARRRHPGQAGQDLLQRRLLLPRRQPRRAGRRVRRWLQPADGGPGQLPPG